LSHAYKYVYNTSIIPALLEGGDIDPQAPSSYGSAAHILSI